MPVTLENGETLNVITLEDAVNIADAGNLKSLLIRALASRIETHIVLEHATDLDVTAVQLLWATQHEARRCGIGFTFEGTVPKEISAALADAGFEKFSVSENR